MQIYSTGKKTDLEPLTIRNYRSSNINQDEIQKSTKTANKFKIKYEVFWGYLLHDLIILNCLVFLTPYLAKKNGLFFTIGFFCLFWFYLYFLQKTYLKIWINEKFSISHLSMNKHYRKQIYKFFIIKELLMHFFVILIMYILIINTFLNILYYYYENSIINKNKNMLILGIFSFCIFVLIFLLKFIKRIYKKFFVALIVFILSLLVLVLTFKMPDYFNYNKQEIDINIYKKSVSNFTLIALVFLLKINQVYQHNQKFYTITFENYFKVQKRFLIIQFIFYVVTIFIGYFSLPQESKIQAQNFLFRKCLFEKETFFVIIKIMYLMGLILQTRVEFQNLCYSLDRFISYYGYQEKDEIIYENNILQQIEKNYETRQRINSEDNVEQRFHTFISENLSEDQIQIYKQDNNNKITSNIDLNSDLSKLNMTLRESQNIEQTVQKSLFLKFLLLIIILFLAFFGQNNLLKIIQLGGSLLGLLEYGFINFLQLRKHQIQLKCFSKLKLIILNFLCFLVTLLCIICFVFVFFQLTQKQNVIIQMKKLEIFMFLCCLVLSEDQVELFSFEEEEPEIEESEEIIDNGCISSKPALCPDGICYPDYSHCRKLAGCTSNQTSLMCPSGVCVESFENCQQSTYQCAIPEYQRCPDGLCRKDCSQIFTNGCNSKNPYYCPSGKCMKYQSQCIDYRCTINQPYICNDLRCVAHPNSCPINHSSYLIKEADNVFIINQIDQSKKFVNVFSAQHVNLRTAKFTFMTNYLMYNKFTASYAKLSQKGVEEIEIALDFESYTKSQVDGSKVYYPETNLETEKLTNLIYSKEFSFLQPYEFIRSAVIQISIKDYEQNHFFFSKFPSIQFAFNKLYNYPNLNLQEEDIQKINDQYKLSFNIHDPSNYYCLGVLDEVSKLWRCASRKIIDFNDSTIEFKVPFPGIYAVLYYPIQEANNQEEECGAVCAYRKFLMTLFVILIPVSYLLFNYIYSEYGEEIEKERQRLLQMVKLGKSKRLTAEEIRQQEEQEAEELLEELNAEGRSEISEDEIVIKQEEEVNEVATNDIKEDNFDIQGSINVFVNPLVLTQDDDDQTNKEEQSKLVKDKVKMKFKLSSLLKKKLRLLKKISTLSNQKDSLMIEIEKLTKLQGINDIIDKEPQENN